MSMSGQSGECEPAASLALTPQGIDPQAKANESQLSDPPTWVPKLVTSTNDPEWTELDWRVYGALAYLPHL